jgi:putative ABC transport system permease protein
MIASYLKFSWRHLMKNRQFSLLNLTGLSTGLAAAILIYLWIYDEMHVDRFLPNDQQLYQVMGNVKQGDQIGTSDAHSIILGETLQKEIPGIESSATTTPAGWFKHFNVTSGATTIKATGNFASRDYFTVFPHTLLHGNRSALLTNKNAVVISAALAKKLFNTTDNIIGKVLEWKWWNFTRQVVITGVYKPAPANATEQFDFITSIDAWGDIINAQGIPDLSGGPFNTYIVLRKGTDVNRLNAGIAGFIKNKFPNSDISLFIRKYSDQHLYGNYENGIQAGGRIEYVKLFAIIALFILVIACINFMNLATAKAAKRMKEVGIKKTLGVSRPALVLSFLSESVLMSGLALLIALILAGMVLPWFNTFTGKQLVLQFDWEIIATILFITIGTGLVAGSYPALYLSRFRPALTLKGKFISSAAEIWVRKGLVVFQFTLSIVFIIAVLVVYRQIHYIQTRNPGYDKDHVICFEIEGKTAAQMDIFLNSVKNIPGVLNATSSSGNIVIPAGQPHGGVYWDDKNKNDEIRFQQLMVNYDFMETLGLHIKQGRSFSRAYSTDTDAVIVNETAVKAMGLTEPIGKTLTVWGQQKHIAGVVKDFHFNSLHESVKPFIIKLSPTETALLMVRLDRNNERAAIKALQSFYKTFNPGFALAYQYVDESYQAQYTSEQLVATLSKYFAALTIIISCLGLFGLAAFTAESRRKEIGIRKVLGATANQIAGMLSKEFLYLVIVAMLIAFPLAWWSMHQWLQGFAYRVSMGIHVFLISGIAIFLITLLTIGFQAIKSALINPVANLRTE